jgi:hypothetical protein
MCGHDRAGPTERHSKEEGAAKPHQVQPKVVVPDEDIFDDAGVCMCVCVCV